MNLLLNFQRIFDRIILGIAMEFIQRIQMESQKTLQGSLLPQELVCYAAKPSAYILSSLSPDSEICGQKFAALVTELQSKYKSDADGVFYHNLTHAFDVMTVMDRFLSELCLTEDLGLQKNDRTWVLLSAYAHDNGHQGFDNFYYINHDHELALKYSYMSPLQNMHSSNLMQLLKKYSIKVSLEKKRMMVGMILATDNFHHYTKTQQLQVFQNKTKNSCQPLSKNKQMILECLLHAADLNNPTKQPVLFQKWSDRINQQFQNQKKTQHPSQYSVQPNRLTILKQQKIFIGNLVLPFFKELGNIFPQLSSYEQKIVTNLNIIVEEQKKISEQTKIRLA